MFGVGVFKAPLTSILKGSIPHLALGILLDTLWLLGEMESLGDAFGDWVFL